MAGLVVFLGIEDHIARSRTQRQAEVAGGRRHPALHQRGDVNHHELLRCRGREGRDRGAQRGNRRVGHRRLAPGAGDRLHAHRSGGSDPVHIQLQRRLADLAGRGAGGKRRQVELDQSRAPVAHVQVRQAAVVGGRMSAVHIRVPRYGGVGRMRRARCQNRTDCRQHPLHPDTLAHRSSPDSFF